MKLYRTKGLKKNQGFTLIEMSLVLIVIGLVILTVFPALNAIRSATQRNATRDNLQTLLRATAAFVQANGCLPCPTPPTTTGAGLGWVRGDTSSTPAACGACAIPEGLPPFASLGLPVAVARDGWSRWIRMRVDPSLTAYTVVPPTYLCQGTTSDPTGCKTGNKASLCQSGLHTTTAPTVVTPPNLTQAQPAAVIFVSHGANGYGAYLSTNIASGGGLQLPFPRTQMSCTKGGYEKCNANDAGASTRPSFFDATTVTGGTAPYDDVLVFVDRNSLVSFFNNSSCQSAW